MSATIQQPLQLTSQGGGGGGGPVLVTIPDLTSAAYLIESDHASSPQWLRFDTDVPGGSRVLTIGSDITGSPDLYEMWSSANTLAFRWRDKSRNNDVLRVNTLTSPAIRVGNNADGGQVHAIDGFVVGVEATSPPAGGAGITLPPGEYVKNTQGFGGQFLIGSNSTTIFVGSTSNTVADIQINVDTTKTIELNVESLTRLECDSTGIGFFAATPVAKPTITGSRNGNAALLDLLTALASLGLITDSTVI